jgi:transposase
MSASQEEMLLMSLKAQLPSPIPSEIAVWGVQHLAADSAYRLVGDVLYAVLHDTDFADLYHAEGKPAVSPVLLAFVTAFQAFENMSDRAAANAVRTRLDWKYALHLPLDDAGFDASVLCEFRQRLLDHQAETRIFEAVLAQLQAQGLLKRRGTQRSDSTHVLAAVRSLNRLETVGEALRAALNALAVAAPDWLTVHADPAWIRRYGLRFDEGRLPEGQTKRHALAVQIGQDGYNLLHVIYAATALAWLREVPAMEVL